MKEFSIYCDLFLLPERWTWAPTKKWALNIDQKGEKIKHERNKRHKKKCVQNNPGGDCLSFAWTKKMTVFTFSETFTSLFYHWNLQILCITNKSRKHVTATTSDLKAANLPPRFWRQVGEARPKCAVVSAHACLRSWVCVKTKRKLFRARQNQRIKQTGTSLGRKVCAQSALRGGFTRGAALKRENRGASDASQQQLQVSPRFRGQ